MNDYLFNKKEENYSRVKSAIITTIIWAVILLFVFTYTFTTSSIIENKPETTTMLINFGDNKNGKGIEEPAEQEGSVSSISQPENSQPEAKATVEKPTLVVNKPEEIQAKEKIITGKNEKMTTSKTEKSEEKKVSKKDVIKDKNSKATTSESHTNKHTSTTKKPTSNSGIANSKTGSGDGLGNAAIGNLIKGKGTKPGTQGTGTDSGNSGDPLGGQGNGDSKIGIDRKLTQFIPGTMGRGGAQPLNKCTASGTITIAFSVDKAGNVTSASRLAGTTDPCISSTSISWVKQYVKAEKANVHSTGTYKITF